ncbi:MAG: hypothetical protein ACOYBD_05140 [Bilifractor sp.]
MGNLYVYGPEMTAGSLCVCSERLITAAAAENQSQTAKTAKTAKTAGTAGTAETDICWENYVNPF